MKRTLKSLAPLFITLMLLTAGFVLLRSLPHPIDPTPPIITNERVDSK